MTGTCGALGKKKYMDIEQELLEPKKISTHLKGSREGA